MDPDSWANMQYVIFVVLICLSAFFSMSETALLSVNKLRIRALVDDGVKNAMLVQRVLENSGKLLSAILIGNNLVNIFASSLATVICMDLFGSTGVGIATGVVTFVILLFGEITPKTFATMHAEKVSMMVIKPIYACVIILTPVIFIINLISGALLRILGINSKNNAPLVTEAELLTMVNVSHEEGVLEQPEKDMINNVVYFGDSDAREIMVPRTDIYAIPDGLSYKEVIDCFKEAQFSRLPVYEENVDSIIGFLYIRDMVFVEDKDNFRIKDFLREAYYTYETKSCAELFSIMKNKSIAMSIVLDEYGGTAGIVTLEDLIEEIVGDITDEFDEVDQEIVFVKENEFLIDGTTRIAEVNEALGTEFESEDFDSIGGYVVGLFGRFPEQKEVYENENVKFIVEDIDKNRIEKLRVILLG